MTVALVTTGPETIGTPDLDLPELVAALAAVGISAQTPIWHDDSVDWSAYELIIIRSPWDYSSRPADFLDWLSRVSWLVPVLNCRHTIEWNLNKRYLEQLGASGVAVVPSVFATSDEAARDALSRIDGDVVVKPNISAGAKDTGLFQAADPAALKLARKIIDGGFEAMIQPAIADVAVNGETAIYFFDGTFSHALRKGPILDVGGTLRGGEYTEVVEAVVPTADQLEVAQSALKVAEAEIRETGCDCASTTPLYARLDLVASVDGPLLLEAELFEPSYFVHTSATAAANFARAVRKRLRQ